MGKQENSLQDSPYTWKEFNEEVRIFWHDTLATILRKDRASQFLAKILEASPEEAQLLMAKMTGNFKRGNERQSLRKKES